MRPEITLNEVCEVFRANRLKGNAKVLCQEILEGRFDWAHGTIPIGSQRAVVYIYTAPFLAWLERMLGHPPAGKEMLQ